MLLRQTSFRALAEPRRFRAADGTVSDGSLRVRFGEVEQRGVALTPRAGDRYDAAMAAAGSRRGVESSTSRPPSEHGRRGTGLLSRRRPHRTRCLRRLPARSAAGIFRSNLDDDAAAADGRDDPTTASDWMAGAIGHHIHDPYDLYEKAPAS